MSDDRTGGLYIEFLVALAIITCLFAMVVSGVGSAREAARRTMCLNNQKQIALGLLNYHALHETFPPGYVARDVTPASSAGQDAGPGTAWSLLLLPFIDQQPLYATIDMSIGVMSLPSGPALSV